MQPENLHGWFSHLLPEAPGLVIDIGAGSGRDAAWFASKGYRVIAVEPSKNMRVEAQKRHDTPAIQWLSDRLPSLTATMALGVSADVVHLGAVWMHLPAADRTRAFRKLVSLTRSGGLIVMTIRDGAEDQGRGFHAADVEDIENLARAHGLVVLPRQKVADLLGRKDVQWHQIALRLPDDGTNALPILRHIILNDSKTSTYKLGLLRALCRAAAGAAGMAKDQGDDHVVVPLGLVALNWLRLYLPLLAADLPQSSLNIKGGERLDFCKESTRAILAGVVPAINLRPGATFSSQDAKIVHSALKAAAVTIRDNPAHFTTYAQGGAIFPYVAGSKTWSCGTLTLDATYLASFGALLVPRDIWRAMQRYSAWIEPSIVAEWIRIIKGYAQRMTRTLNDGAIAAAMTWIEPDRDVAIARTRALSLMDQGSLYCVWSGKQLTTQTLDMDHAFPWSAWPCGDLWNLMPSHRALNQKKKKDKLPTADLLSRSRDSVLSWWRDAYERADHLAPQFISEAKTSLPTLWQNDGLELGDIFEGMRFQRLRLWRDQQIPEWDGL
ncbi:SAM-dependent methyltransferase [Rhodoblastus acidophilus]|uniref:class I SAM-dependent methyltransferase n=1 Tax=Rhodoblastus acidophilus TaxID=1074 RepID=UPI0022243157|nr:class I SAM-dependent methyltransferase [Rhodoblastus acidophilus]MCW2318856.1 SAM-dependent methyltransferase [Rhodoblastus acidophilus]